MNGHSPRPGRRYGPSPGLRAGVCAAVGVVVLLGAPPSTSQSNPFQGKRLYVSPVSHASRQADEWARSRPRDAALMRVIAEQPQAIWMGDWLRDVRGEVDARVTAITRAGALPVFVVYNIPHRDCGLYSAGGARGGDEYRRWILGFARGLRNRAAAAAATPAPTRRPPACRSARAD